MSLRERLKIAGHGYMITDKEQLPSGDWRVEITSDDRTLVGEGFGSTYEDACEAAASDFERKARGR